MERARARVRPRAFSARIIIINTKYKINIKGKIPDIPQIGPLGVSSTAKGKTNSGCMGFDLPEHMLHEACARRGPKKKKNADAGDGIAMPRFFLVAAAPTIKK